ncbi:hypothetical protein JB92DRAFT_2799166, partial [Gautieria morchelliformis]
LWQEEIERTYVLEAEFASEDEAERKRVKALNSLGGFIFGLKTQLGDQEGLGEGHGSSSCILYDKKTILAALKGTTHWIDANVQSATADELEEKLSEVQAIVTPTTSKLYADGTGPQSHGPGEEDEKLTEDD